MNNRPETLDLGERSLQLGLLVSGLRGQIAHQPMQRIDVGWERGEIEIHAASLTSACGDTHADHRYESIRRKPADGQSLLAQPATAGRHR